MYTSHAWSSPGTFAVKVIAEDVHGAQSQWSSERIVVISSGSNNPPVTPYVPSGPSSGTTGVSYQYSTHATDPDDDNVKYGWDWDGDSVVDEWTSFYSSGAPVYTSHAWSSAGTFTVKVIAEDVYGAQSSFSNSLTVTISSGGNQPPNDPMLSGTTSGKAGTSYTYEASTTDPDGDQIYYFFDWGDGANTGWLGPYNSGSPASANHIWGSGDYQIKAKAKDTNGEESGWTTLDITMPKSKLYLIQPLLRTIFQNPCLFQLIKKYFF